MEAFSSSQKSGYSIKWVDASHVLRLFSSANAASEALALPQAKLRTRSLSLRCILKHIYRYLQEKKTSRTQIPKETFDSYFFLERGNEITW